MGHLSLPIILLAAGASSRMRGRDKLAEPIDGTPLLRRQASVARACTAGPVLVTLPPPPHPRYAFLSGLEVTPLPVPDASEGMGASLRTGVAALPPSTDRVMVLLADLPDLTTEDLVAVAARSAEPGKDLVWRGATESGAPGHPIVFDKSLFPGLVKLTGDSGGRQIIAQAADRVGLVTLQGNRALMDLDTPEDWAAWRAERAKTI